jgi:hypothetical protein
MARGFLLGVRRDLNFPLKSSWKRDVETRRRKFRAIDNWCCDAAGQPRLPVRFGLCMATKHTPKKYPVRLITDVSDNGLRRRQENNEI